MRGARENLDGKVTPDVAWKAVERLVAPVHMHPAGRSEMFRSRRAAIRSFTVFCAAILLTSSCTNGGDSQTLESKGREEVSVKEAFQTFMRERLESARADIHGTLDVGGFSGALEGLLEAAGESSRLTMNVTIDELGYDQANEEVEVAGVTFVSNNFGPWVKSPQQESGEFETFMDESYRNAREIGTLRGSNGERLHRLRPPPDVKMPTDFLDIDGMQGGAAGHVDFFVRPDGTLVTMRISARWRQQTGEDTLPVKMHFDMNFRDFGDDITITEPENVWTRVEYKRSDFSIAHPPGWVVGGKSPGGWQQSFGSGVGDGLLVRSRQIQGPFSLKAFRDAVIAMEKKSDLKASPVSVERFVVDTTPAWLMKYSIRDRQLYMLLLASDIRTYQMVFYVGADALSPEYDSDVQLFKDFLSTVSFQA